MRDAAVAAPAGAEGVIPALPELKAPSGEVLLEGKGIVKTYEMGDRGLQVLRGVSIEVRKGEILAIQGPSGAGKSTLLHVLGLLDEPDEGKVLFRGEDVLARGPRERARYRNEKIGFVFQFYHLFPDLTALENVCLPKMVEKGVVDYGAAKTATLERARKLISLVGLTERADHLPSELSGGERQRVAIARALMNEPEVVLCDEPTGNLDQKTAAEILTLLWTLNRETGQTFVIVTHDMGLAARAHRAVSVIDGVLAAAGTPVRARGFSETRFRLRETTPFLALRLSPALVFAAALVCPPIALLWLAHAQGRFFAATRRGRSGTAALLTFLVPVFGQLVWPLAVFWGPLRAANRILAANREAPLGRLACSAAPLAFGAALIALVGLVLAGGVVTADGALDARRLLEGPVPIAGSLLAVSAAWIQSLLNRFFDSMGAAKRDES